MFQAKAQFLSPNYTTIDKNAGLPEAFVQGLTEDADGFVWFSNGSALCRWDGHHFQQFWLTYEKGMQYHDYKWTASWDSLHILVLNDRDYFLLNTKTLAHWKLMDKPIPPYKPIKNNRRIYHYNNGVLWLPSWEGIKIYDIAKHEQKYLPNPYYISGGASPSVGTWLIPFPDSSALYPYISVADQKVFWTYISSKHDTIVKTDLPKPFRDYEINYISNVNASLTLTLNFDNTKPQITLRKLGVWHLDTRRWERIVLPKNTSFMGIWLYCLPIDNNTVMFGDVTSIEPSFVLDTRTLNVSLAHPIFNYLSQGSLGILQHSSGVYLQDALYNKKIARFHGVNGLFQYNPSVDILLNGSQVRSFVNPTVTDFAQTKNKILLSLDGEGLVHQTDGKAYLDTTGTKLNIWELMTYNEDMVLAACSEALFWFNPHVEKIVLNRLPAFPNKPALLDYVSIPSLFKDSRSEVWVGLGGGNGVVRFDTLKQTYKHYPFGKNKGNLPIRYPSCIAEDKTGDLWMSGQSGGGLVRWIRAKDSFEVVEKMEGLMENGYSFSPAKSGLAFDAAGHLYIGTHIDGLLRYDIQKRRFQNWRKEQGLTSNEVTSICFDSEGFLWVGTTDGLNRFDPKTEQIKQFWIEHGLPSNEISTVKRWNTEGSIIFIGCKLGYRLVDIRHINDVQTANNLLLTRFDVNGKPRKMAFDAPIYLKHNENNLDIEWSVINFIDGQLNQFSYRFLGTDDTSWRDLGHTNLARLIGLGSGDYRLQLRVILNGGKEILSPELRFHISTPFWKSVWFFLLIGATAIGLIVFYYRMRIRNLERETSLRKNISADLHDDIGATLSNVNILTTLVRQRLPNDVDVLPLLKRIEEEISTSSESLDDIIWSVNPQNDSMERVLSRMRQYASEVFEARGIEGTLNFPSNLSHLSLPMEKRRDFYFIFKEALNNLSKYAQCSTATVSLTATEDKLNLIVSDNGVGFDPLSINEGNGQKTMRHRAERLKAALKIESSVGKGTKVELSLPLV